MWYECNICHLPDRVLLCRLTSCASLSPSFCRHQMTLLGRQGNRARETSMWHTGPCSLFCPFNWSLVEGWTESLVLLVGLYFTSFTYNFSSLALCHIDVDVCTCHLCCLRAANEKICCRCGKRFSVYADGSYVRNEQCVYHWGKAWKKRGQFVINFCSSVLAEYKLSVPR